MKAFVATSIRNSQEALRIIKILENLSIDYQCCITENEDMHGQQLFDHNIKGIRDADVFISVLKCLGKDVSTEIGIAHGLGKKTIGVTYDIDPNDVMPYHAAGTLVEENQLEALLKGLISTEAVDLRFSDFSQHKFQDIAEDLRIIAESRMFVDGPYTKALENKLSERYARPVMATSSGTNALIISLDTILRDKKEVIVSALTFNATIQAVIHAGGIPVFADVDKHTWNLDPQKVEERITRKTGAIIPVNLFGVPVDIESFKNISQSRNIPLIYDSCQAFGALTPEGEVGTFGDIEAFSLDATKVLSGGLGGFITFKNPELYEQARYVKNFGNDEEKRTIYIGLNGRMSEFNAALALRSFEKVDARLSRIRVAALKYRNALAQISHIEFQEERHGMAAPQYFGIFINYDGTDIAQRIKTDLSCAGIETRIYNPTLLHKLDFFTCEKSRLPNTENMHSRILCLPTHDNVSDAHIEIIAKTLKRYLQ